MFQFENGDFNTFPARNTFVALSAEAGLASLDAATAYAATAACFNIFNQSTMSSKPNVLIKPRLLRLTAKAVNTGGTDFRLHFFVDKIDRWSSGGTELTPVAAMGTMGAATTVLVRRTSQAKIYAGELTLAAASDAKCIGRVLVKNEIFAANEQIEIWFGAPLAAGIDTAGLFRTATVVVPVILGQGDNLSIHEVAASQTADPKFQYELWYDEEGHPKST